MHLTSGFTDGFKYVVSSARLTSLTTEGCICQSPAAYTLHSSFRPSRWHSIQKRAAHFRSTLPAGPRFSKSLSAELPSEPPPLPRLRRPGARRTLDHYNSVLRRQAAENVALVQPRVHAQQKVDLDRSDAPQPRSEHDPAAPSRKNTPRLQSAATKRIDLSRTTSQVESRATRASQMPWLPFINDKKAFSALDRLDAELLGLSAFMLPTSTESIAVEQTLLRLAEIAATTDPPLELFLYGSRTTGSAMALSNVNVACIPAPAAGGQTRLKWPATDRVLWLKKLRVAISDWNRAGSSRFLQKKKPKAICVYDSNAGVWVVISSEASAASFQSFANRQNNAGALFRPVHQAFRSIMASQTRLPAIPSYVLSGMVLAAMEHTRPVKSTEHDSPGRALLRVLQYWSIERDAQSAAGHALLQDSQQPYRESWPRIPASWTAARWGPSKDRNLSIPDPAGGLKRIGTGYPAWLGLRKYCGRVYDELQRRISSYSKESLSRPTDLASTLFLERYLRRDYTEFLQRRAQMSAAAEPEELGGRRRVRRLTSLAKSTIPVAETLPLGESDGYDRDLKLEETYSAMEESVEDKDDNI